MTVYLYPADPVAGAPEYSAETWRLLEGGIVGGKTAARPLGGRTGVWPGTPTSTVSISGSTITIASHGGVMDLETAADAGPYRYAVDPAETRTLTAASSSDQRVDSIFVQMSDPAEGDGSSTPGATVNYVTGTVGPAGGARGAAGGPPSVPVRSFEIAQIVVPKSGTGSPAVSWVAPHAVAAGGIIPTSDSDQYPASPYVGMYVDDADLGPMRWNGTRWQQIYPSTRQVLRSSNINIPTGGSGTALTSGWTNTGGFSFGGIVYSAGTLAADQDGVYELGYMLRWDTSPAANFIWEIIPTVNGSAVNSGRQSDINPSAVTSSLNYMSSTGKVQLNEGDAVGLTAFQSSGSTIQIIEGQFSLTLVVPL